MKPWDVLVNGGGMVGAALACALVRGRRRVLLLDKASPPAVPPEGPPEARVSALTLASQRLLAALGAWGDLAPHAQPLRAMEVWDAGSRGHIRFEAAELGEPALGWIVENRRIRAALLARLQGVPEAAVRHGTGPQALDREPRAVVLSLGGGQRVAGRLLVGADGAQSWVRRQAGIGVDLTDYGQQALVAVVRPARHHEDTAWQRFLPGGPLAFLPLPRGRCAIVWSLPTAEAESLAALPEEAFARRLAEALEQRLGEILEVGPRSTHPLAARHARQYVQPRLALVGDAAHTIHPLAGQGVNLGFADAAALAEVLEERPEADPGALSLLRRYERWRKGENLAMLTAMTAFWGAFGSTHPLLRGLRGLGLSLAHRAGPAKLLIMRRACGLSGDLPRLERGSPWTP